MAARTGTIRANAQSLDASGLFPVLDVAWLRTSGALAAVIPIALGGLGVGTDSTQATATANILHGLGVGSIALGRVFEAHLNAVRLVMRFASVQQRLTTARDVLSPSPRALGHRRRKTPVPRARRQRHRTQRHQNARLRRRSRDTRGRYGARS